MEGGQGEVGAFRREGGRRRARGLSTNRALLRLSRWVFRAEALCADPGHAVRRAQRANTGCRHRDGMQHPLLSRRRRGGRDRPFAGDAGASARPARRARQRRPVRGNGCTENRLPRFELRCRGCELRLLRAQARPAAGGAHRARADSEARRRNSPARLHVVQTAVAALCHGPVGALGAVGLWRGLRPRASSPCRACRPRPRRRPLPDRRCRPVCGRAPAAARPRLNSAG